MTTREPILSRDERLALACIVIGLVGGVVLTLGILATGAVG